MMWSVDPDVEAARKLPEWRLFHKACGKVGLFFDMPYRERKRGPFNAVAFTVKRNTAGGCNSFELARASGKTVLETIKSAYDKSGRTSPEADQILEAMLNPAAVPAADPLAAMFSDDSAPPAVNLEDMFG